MPDELLARQMPQATEAEQAVIGAMLIDTACIPEVIELLRPEDFYIEENEDFDINKDEPIQQFRVYYYKDGKKLVAKNGVYVGEINTMYPLVGFFIQGKDNLKALKGVCITLVAVVFLAILALIIWLIYLVVSIKQSRKYSASYQEMLAEKKAEKARRKQEKE